VDILLCARAKRQSFLTRYPENTKWTNSQITPSNSSVSACSSPGPATADVTTRRQVAADVLQALVESGYESEATEIAGTWTRTWLAEYNAQKNMGGGVEGEGYCCLFVDGCCHEGGVRHSIVSGGTQPALSLYSHLVQGMSMTDVSTEQMRHSYFGTCINGFWDSCLLCLCSTSDEDI